MAFSLAFLCLIVSFTCSACIFSKNPHPGLKPDPNLSSLPHLSKLQIPQHLDEYRLLAFGDYGKGTGRPQDAQVLLSQAMEISCKEFACHFALGLGDNFYPSGVSSVDDPQFWLKFELPYAGLNLPFFLTLGNHDYGGSIDAQLTYSASSVFWNFPARYYLLPNLPEWLQILAIDTVHMDERQLNFIKKSLCADAQKNSWKILFGHYPIYASGLHGDNPEVGRVLLPIIKDCGIQVFLAGHEHHLESIHTDFFEQWISGAAGEFRNVHLRREKNSIQEFIYPGLGYLIIGVQEQKIHARFFDQKGIILFEKVISHSKK